VDKLATLAPEYQGSYKIDTGTAGFVPIAGNLATPRGIRKQDAT
jgi:hypothetical protein